MFFTLANSRSFIARPAAITADTPRVVTPDGTAAGPFINALEDTTARIWQVSDAGQVPELTAEWDAGVGGRIALTGIGLARCRMRDAVVELRRRSVPTEPWNTVHAFRLPEGPRHVAERFDEVSARLWQLRFLDIPAASSVGWIWLGRWLRLPRGPQPPFTPPDLSTAYEVSAHLATAAQSLGARAQLTAGQSSLVIGELSLPWLRGQWEPVRAHLAQGRPLLFVPDASVQAVGLIQATGQLQPVRQTTRALGGISVPFRYLP